MNEYMKEAKELADSNLVSGEGGPFGACVVKDGKIIGRGHNQVIKNNDPTAHAEVMAIREACQNLQSYDLKDCELYTSCFPCPMCLGAIIWSNIRMVYYGNTKEDADQIGFRDDVIYDYLEKLSQGECDSDILDLQCMNREETIHTFQEFQEKKDKIIY
jgi:tRNA(Arg) A34 adenosine deaminase TadA